MPYYIIKHKDTGKVMNFRQGNKGYSYWLSEEEAVEYDLQIPRLFLSEKKAKKSVTEWAKGPVKWVDKEYLPNDILEKKNEFRWWEPEQVRKPVNNGRKKEDLQVIAIKLEAV